VGTVGRLWAVGEMPGYDRLCRADDTALELDVLGWVALMTNSNPFTTVRYEGPTAHLTNDWRNVLTLNLTDPALT
jgi:hypothetical protein